MSRLRQCRAEPRRWRLAPVDSGDAAESTSAVEPADWSGLADDQMMRAQMREQLVGALTHLPQVYRVPVLLRDIHGLSTEEASAVLKVKPQTLKSRLHRGRLILRKHLGDFAGGLELHSRESTGQLTASSAKPILERGPLVAAERGIERSSDSTLHQLHRHGGDQAPACAAGVDGREARVAAA